MSDNKSCGTTDCECHNTNMPTNCERSKKPNKSFCQKFTEEVRQTMSDKPEKNGVFKTQSPCLCGSDGKFCGMTCNHQEKVVYCGLSRLPEQRCVNMAERADLAKPSESVMDDIGPCNFVLDCTRSSEACSYLLLEHPRCFKALPSPPDKE